MRFEVDLSIPGMKEQVDRAKQLGVWFEDTRPLVAPGPGIMCVYLFSVLKTGPVKIGISGNCLVRLTTIRASSGRRLKCYRAIVKGTREEARALETTIHRTLASVRLPGEWFRIPVDKALAIMDELDTPH